MTGCKTRPPAAIWREPEDVNRASAVLFRKRMLFLRAVQIGAQTVRTASVEAVAANGARLGPPGAARPPLGEQMLKLEQ